MTDTSNTDPQAELEQLRNELAAAKEATMASERRSIFAEAGLSEHKARELLESKYESGMTADQLKEVANQYGLLPEPNAQETVTQTQTNATELDGLRRIQNATAGGVPIGALPEFGDAIDGARSIEELNHLLSIGGAGAGLGLKGRVV